MNARIFGRIINLSVITWIGEEIEISYSHKNTYLAEFDIKYANSDSYKKLWHHFQVKSEKDADVDEACDKIKKSFENFKEAFMKYQPTIINCDVK